MELVSPGICSLSTYNPTLVAQAELKEKLTKMYDVRDINSVFVFGFRNQVGCMRGLRCCVCPGSSGGVLITDIAWRSLAAASPPALA